MIRSARSLTCSCFFCDAGRPHPEAKPPHFYHAMTERRGILTKRESLDPADIVHTTMCALCTHEEVLT